ncbi:MAG: ammonium transporter [Alphaproteobacteria bacterium]|nr:ammonium transporter [Alphaproteobacteria bacterium]
MRILHGNLLVVPAFGGLLALAMASSALADEAPKLDRGDTAWMLTSTALVLMMTIPGLALFYGGMVRKMNVLATLMQSFACACLVSILWLVLGYSLAFTEGGPLIGGLSRVMMKDVAIDTLSGTIPETVFMAFQMTFAIITPALILGGVADRMKFSAMLLFVALWSILVYSPVAHWVWGPGGFLGGTGIKEYPGFLGLGAILDFAGGTVVHIISGVSGLVAAIAIGKRKGYGTEPMAPHNLTLTLIGGSLLWVGWFGFNAGSAVASDGRAGMAFLVTHLATAAAALSWMFCEWGLRGKPSLLGIVSGAVAGLVAITPASGFVGPTGALAIGIAGGAVCFWAATILKNQIGYDDALDAFGIHAMGGATGAVLTGVFAVEKIGGTAGLLEGAPMQVVAQAVGVIVTAVYAGVVAFLILKVVDVLVGLRVDQQDEIEGLDRALHGEVVP